MVPKINSWFPSLCCLCKLSLHLRFVLEGTTAPWPQLPPSCLFDCTFLSVSWLLIFLPEGLRLVNVQRGSAYPPLFERLRQGLLVHQASPRGVDQERTLTHLQSTHTSRGGAFRPRLNRQPRRRIGLIKTSTTMIQETRLGCCSGLRQAAPRRKIDVGQNSLNPKPGDEMKAPPPLAAYEEKRRNKKE